MLIAREKYQTNIVEYILYMFHIEDLIRLNHFNMEELEKTVISKYHLPENQMKEVREWYADIVRKMEKESVQELGHISSIKELIFKLNDLHLQLINSLEEERYLEHYKWASGYIKELKSKMNNPELTEVEVCLDGLYAFMLLKMRGDEVTDETTQAMSIFSQMLRYVSKRYNEMFRPNA
jgi:hypothetical protein